MQKADDFRILRDCSVDTLQDKVVKHLQNGYTLHGAMYIHTQSKEEAIYYQAVAKYSEVESSVNKIELVNLSAILQNIAPAKPQKEPTPSATVKKADMEDEGLHSVTECAQILNVPYMMVYNFINKKSARLGTIRKIKGAKYLSESQLKKVSKGIAQIVDRKKKAADVEFKPL